MKAETIQNHPAEQIQAFCDQFLTEYRCHLDSSDFPFLTEERIKNFYWLFYGKLDAISSIFFDGYEYAPQAKEQLNRIYDEYFEKLRDQPDASGLPPAGASGAAVGQGENHQPAFDDIPDDAYTVEHIEPDPDACPDCLGTGLDFTHSDEFCHCMSCKITHQPGNRLPIIGPVGSIDFLLPIVV